jgi:hypothetical protein
VVPVRQQAADHHTGEQAPVHIPVVAVLTADAVSFGGDAVVDIEGIAEVVEDRIPNSAKLRCPRNSYPLIKEPTLFLALFSYIPTHHHH